MFLSTERRLEGNNNNNEEEEEEEEEEEVNEAQYGAYDDALVEYDDAQNNNAQLNSNNNKTHISTVYSIIYHG